MIALVPQADLSLLAATEPAFQTGGFRAGNVAVLRVRLQQIVCGAQEVSDTLRRALARRSRSRTLTGLLSLDAIAETRHALAALLGSHVLWVALLLDERPEVRDKAESWMKTDPPPLAAEPAEALDRLRELFAGLTELLGSSAPSGSPLTREAWQQQKEQLETRLHDLQTENRRLKGVDDRLSHMAAQQKACEKKLAESLQQATAAEKALRQKMRELEETSAELTRETSHREDRLVAALDLALAKEFHGWLASARAVASAAAHPEPQNELLAQAEAALKKQGEIDRHSGHRALLTERLERLETALKKVQSALRNALRQTPDLKAVESDLATEIRTLSRLLEPEAAATPLEEALVTRIHAARDNDLPRLRDLPELFASLHVLDDAAILRIRQAFQKRLAAVQALGVPPDPRMEERQDASTQLGRALAGQTPAILFIDGHNVLFGLPARYMPARGTALPDADKRKKLADDIVRITAPNPAIRAWIVFDGPTRSDAQASPNVRVIYSGGEGEHRADGVILDNLRFFKSSSPDTPVFLASNDNDLCTAARRLGALDIAVLDLGAFL
ncbi:MAG: hypothetical protein WCK89_14475 [bacterium]